MRKQLIKLLPACCCFPSLASFMLLTPKSSWIIALISSQEMMPALRSQKSHWGNWKFKSPGYWSSMLPCGFPRHPTATGKQFQFILPRGEVQHRIQNKVLKCEPFIHFQYFLFPTLTCFLTWSWHVSTWFGPFPTDMKISMGASPAVNCVLCFVATFDCGLRFQNPPHLTVRSRVTWEEPWGEPLLLHIKRSQLRWLRHLLLSAL